MKISISQETTVLGSPQKTKPDVICVLGMHRSGTSLLTRLLNVLGVYLGADHELMPPNGSNPKGYWERKEIVSINDEILARFGGSWDAPSTFPSGWETASIIDDLKARALALIQRDFHKTEIWGWKDPRTCLTLPFWQQLLPETRYLVCLRNPVDVARSLGVRNNFSTEKCSSLWLSYVNHALKHSDGHPRLIIFYEDLMADWQRELRRIADFVGRTKRAEQVDVRNAVREFIERDLQHYRTSIVSAAANLNIDRRVRALYLAQRISVSLGGEIGSHNGVDEQIEQALEVLSYSFSRSDQSDLLQAQQDDELARDRNMIAASEARLMGRRKRLETASARLDERGQTLRALCSEISEQDAAFQRLSRQLGQKDVALAQNTEKINELADQLRHSEAQLKSIRDTLGWRLLNRYGLLKHAFLLPVYRLFGRVSQPEKEPAESDHERSTEITVKMTR
jgi:hypothetical protein